MSKTGHTAKSPCPSLESYCDISEDNEESDDHSDDCRSCYVVRNSRTYLVRADDTVRVIEGGSELSKCKFCCKEALECSEVGMYLAMSRQADREGYPEIAEAFKRYAWEEAEHAAKFAELLGECVWDTKTNVEKRMLAEQGACEDKLRIAKLAKQQNLDAIHDTVHEMCKDEARHGAGFQGLFNRYFK